MIIFIIAHWPTAFITLFNCPTRHADIKQYLLHIYITNMYNIVSYYEYILGGRTRRNLKPSMRTIQWLAIMMLLYCTLTPPFVRRVLWYDTPCSTEDHGYILAAKRQMMSLIHWVYHVRARVTWIIHRFPCQMTRNNMLCKYIPSIDPMLVLCGMVYTGIIRYVHQRITEYGVITNVTMSLYVGQAWCDDRGMFLWNRNIKHSLVISY